MGTRSHTEIGIRTGMGTGSSTRIGISTGVGIRTGIGVRISTRIGISTGIGTGMILGSGSSQRDPMTFPDRSPLSSLGPVGAESPQEFRDLSQDGSAPILVIPVLPGILWARNSGNGNGIVPGLSWDPPALEFQERNRIVPGSFGSGIPGKEWDCSRTGMELSWEWDGIVLGSSSPGIPGKGTGLSQGRDGNRVVPGQGWDCPRILQLQNSQERDRIIPGQGRECPGILWLQNSWERDRIIPEQGWDSSGKGMGLPWDPLALEFPAGKGMGLPQDPPALEFPGMGKEQDCPGIL
ncbi:hypothetical protein HGM15179_019095 [Zosterops borbonicus]|uniref:Uncharacterized protein n=1 Tax=Zosterops borbonicus TaxID=364589 RepID=A0A8K1DAJ5_9PASS|nr:hypothetical protein HGM15179_019095 [Zosterops borbonicus]